MFDKSFMKIPIFGRKEKFSENFSYQTKTSIYNYYSGTDREIGIYIQDCFTYKIKLNVIYGDESNDIFEDCLLNILLLKIKLKHNSKNKKYYLEINYKSNIIFNYYFQPKFDFDKTKCYYVATYTYRNSTEDETVISRNIKEIISNKSVLEIIKEKISIFYDHFSFSDSNPKIEFYLKFLEWLLINQLFFPFELAEHILFFI